MTKEQISFDAIIVGTGQAGPSLAVELAKAGWKVGIVERHLFGGTCVNTGCIPTKTLVANARVAYVARRAGEYGVMIEGDVLVDMKRVKARKDMVAHRSRNGVEKWLRTTPNCTVFTAHAKFLSDHSVGVNDAVLTAEHIFIDVGGRAAIPSLPGLDQVPYLTNSSMVDVDYLPEHLIILGGSYIALEFAQMYRRFGSRVTVVQRGPRLIQREDTDVSDTVRTILEKEEIEIRLNTDCLGVEKKGAELTVAISCEGVKSAVKGSHLLLATGRLPNTDDLGLENTTIKKDQKGFITVDDQLRTSAPGVWALGDCNGRGGFTHTSYNDYQIVAGNLLRNESRRVTDRIATYAVFIDPPLGRAGMTETEVRKSGRNALTATMPMEQVGRAFEKGETQGFMKVFVDAESKLILGASILGTEGDEAIHCILDTMYAKAPYTVLQNAVHIHPTVSELIPTLLERLKPL